MKLVMKRSREPRVDPDGKRAGRILMPLNDNWSSFWKTMDLAATIKKTGRKPESILATARRLGIKIKTGDAK